MKNLKYMILTLFLFSSCSTTRPIQYSLKDKKYKNDPISVQTAVNLARTAYLKGCSDAHVEHGKKKGSYLACSNKSKTYVENYLIEILDQDGETRSPSK